MFWRICDVVILRGRYLFFFFLLSGCLSCLPAFFFSNRVIINIRSLSFYSYWWRITFFFLLSGCLSCLPGRMCFERILWCRNLAWETYLYFLFFFILSHYKHQVLLLRLTLSGGCFACLPLVFRRILRRRNLSWETVFIFIYLFILSHSKHQVLYYI